jgi:hypothetical protein
VWFRVFVPPKQKKDGSLRVSGCIDACHFKVYASPVSASFDVEDKRFDTEQAFYTFINIIALYRNQRRLSPLNTGLLNGLAGGRKQTIEDKTRTLINGGAI